MGMYRLVTWYNSCGIRLEHIFFLNVDIWRDQKRARDGPLSKQGLKDPFWVRSVNLYLCNR